MDANVNLMLFTHTDTHRETTSHKPSVLRMLKSMNAIINILFVVKHAGTYVGTQALICGLT